MISVEAALDRIFGLVEPLGAEEVPLAEASGRVLAAPARAALTQPPFAASAMDGYAVAGVPVPGAVLTVIGESAAGRAFDGSVSAGEAVRIFTGAPVPPGASHVVIQEDTRREGDRVVLGERVGGDTHIRPAGGDFARGDTHFPRRPLGPADLALLAAMNVARPGVVRRPDVALIATGDELVMPGETPGRDQIVASNVFGLKALVEAAGGRARLLPIARDSVASLECVLGLAEGADLIVTIGGASVGDHDLVAQAAEGLGLERAFYKVAMRPGKPLMAGRMGDVPMIGLPGNPVSAMVCGHVFLVPALRAMLGLGEHPAPRRRGRLAVPLAANGPREHYMRARLGADGLVPFDRQDSSLLAVLAEADALVVRPPQDPARAAGDTVDWIALRADRI